MIAHPPDALAGRNLRTVYDDRLSAPSVAGRFHCRVGRCFDPLWSSFRAFRPARAPARRGALHAPVVSPSSYPLPRALLRAASRSPRPMSARQLRHAGLRRRSCAWSAANRQSPRQRMRAHGPHGHRVRWRSDDVTSESPGIREVVAGRVCLSIEPAQDPRCAEVLVGLPGVTSHWHRRLRRNLAPLLAALGLLIVPAVASARWIPISRIGSIGPLKLNVSSASEIVQRWGQPAYETNGNVFGSSSSPYPNYKLLGYGCRRRPSYSTCSVNFYISEETNRLESLVTNSPRFLFVRWCTRGYVRRCRFQAGASAQYQRLWTAHRGLHAAAGGGHRYPRWYHTPTQQRTLRFGRSCRRHRDRLQALRRRGSLLLTAAGLLAAFGRTALKPVVGSQACSTRLVRHTFAMISISVMTVGLAAAHAAGVTQRSPSAPSWAHTVRVCSLVSLTDPMHPSGVSGPLAGGYNVYALSVVAKTGLPAAELARSPGRIGSPATRRS